MKTLLDLQMHECRWPLDGTLSATHLFCAEPKAGGGSPYCARHTAMAYVPAPKSLLRGPRAFCGPMMLEQVDHEFDEVLL